jgi:hypothetical protein
MVTRDLTSLIQRIVLSETIWLRHYTGKILGFADDNSGMVQVAIYELGCDTPDKAFWCAPRDKMALLTPAVNNWVEVYFLGGDRNRPVYLGIAAEMANQIPKTYDGQPTTQILFEDNNDQFHIKYDAAANAFEMGNTNMLAAARKTDPTLSDSTTDSAYWTWLTSLMTALKTFAAAMNTAVTLANVLAAGVALNSALLLITTPSSQTGKINGGSNQVNIGGQ